jgi:hypothetical protein
VHTSCEEGASCGAGRSSPLLSAVRSNTVWPDLAPAAGRMNSIFEVLPLSTQLNLHCSHRSLEHTAAQHTWPSCCWGCLLRRGCMHQLADGAERQLNVGLLLQTKQLAVS